MIICNSLGTGGAEKQTIALANGLFRLGHQVTLVYLTNNSDLLNHVDEGLKEATILVERKKYFDLAAVKKIRSLLRNHSIDTVLAVNQLPLIYAVFSCQFNSKIKLYFGLHTTKVTGVEALKFYLTGWLLAKFAEKIIYVCKTQMNYWAKRGLHRKGKGIYIHNGIETDQFTVPDVDIGVRCRQQLDIPEGAMVMVSIAMLRPEKRHVDMLALLKKVRDRGCDMYLIFAGEGKERAVIQNTAEELGVKDRLRMVGMVADVRPYLSAADATLLLSNAVETFSIAVLESLSCGCPVIAYDIGGITEQITSIEHGAVIPLGSEQTLIDTVLAREHIIKNSNVNELHNYVSKNFSSQTMTSLYADVFTQ